MLGRSHAILGGTAALAILPLLPSESPARIAAGAAVAAGAALLADLDTRVSTVSRSLGPITQGLALVVGGISGGHRKGTHSLVPVFPALVAALAWLLVRLHPLAAVPIVAVCVALALTAAGPGEVRRHALIGVAGGSIAAALVVEHFVGFSGWWLEVSLGLGTWLHVLGDALTAERVPVLFPLVKRRIGVPVVRRTGNVTERVIAAAALVLAGFLCWRDFGGAGAVAHHLAAVATAR